ncbi:hypothetical protein TNCV_1959521 [Trichonephila clavipes]|nr:hypothetical protein TNCV_1959521 [Trichonephila clavipes]
MSYDYTAYKRSLSLFGLGAHSKTKSEDRFTSSELRGGNWASKLPVAIGIHLYGAALKRDTSFRVNARCQGWALRRSRPTSEPPRPFEVTAFTNN